MFIPWPLLLLAAVLVIGLVGVIVRRTASQDPLMGRRSDDLVRPPTRRIGSAMPAGSKGHPMSETVKTEVNMLLAAGRKIDAIKLVRDETGLGLKDAKDLAEALERRADGRDRA